MVVTDKLVDEWRDLAKDSEHPHKILQVALILTVAHVMAGAKDNISDTDMTCLQKWAAQFPPSSFF